MRVTTITCDRCKREITDNKQIWPVELRCRETSLLAAPVLSAEWCRSCCLEMGIWENKEETVNPIIEPKPTLEDFVRELIQEELENS
jgi:hypothetical protein